MENKPIKKVIIIGGGIAGLRALYNLSEYIYRFEVTLIDKNSYTLEKPALIDVVFDNKKSDDVSFLLPPQARESNAAFIKAEVKKIEPQENYILLDSNEKVKYDYLIMAAGAEIDIDAIKGFKEFGYSICNISQAERLKERINSLNKEKIVIGSAKSNLGKNSKLNVAYEGIVAEIALNLDEYIKEKNLNCQIDIFTPNSTFLNFAGENVTSKIETLLKERGINIHYNRDIKEINKSSISFSDNSTLESNLSIVVPPYNIPPFLENLTTNSWIETDNNMAHLEYNNIFIVGDINALTVPKIGYLALHEADVATTKLIELENLENENKIRYNPDIFIILKAKNEGILIYSNSLYGGDKDIIWVSPIAKWLKIGFSREYHYTHGNLAPVKLIKEIEKVIEYLEK